MMGHKLNHMQNCELLAPHFGRWPRQHLTGWMLSLTPSQQCQSSEGKTWKTKTSQLHQMVPSPHPRTRHSTLMQMYNVSTDRNRTSNSS